MKKLILYSILLTSLFLTSCASPKRYYKRGNMHAAVKKAIKNLRKNKVRDKDIVVLEKAFAIINNKDYNRLQVLLDDKGKNKWPQVNSLSKSIYDRQEELKPYLPLTIKSEGRKARFKMFPVRDLMIKSKEKAAQQYYNSGKEELIRARKGNRAAARNAYSYFDNIARYYNSYKDSRQLMSEAHNLGIAYSVIGLSNESHALLPFRFKDEVLRMYPSDLNTFWTKFDLDPKSRNYDYKVIIRLTHIRATPEQMRNDHFVEEEEVRDGDEYVLDQNGNVAKDSLGNDITKPRYITVRADVYSNEQFKATTLTAYVDIVNLKNGDRLMSRQVTANTEFVNRAMRFDGDKRALSSDTRRNLGNQPMTFPSDEEMLLRAAQALSPKIKDMICNNITLMEE